MARLRPEDLLPSEEELRLMREAQGARVQDRLVLGGCEMG